MYDHPSMPHFAAARSRSSLTTAPFSRDRVGYKAHDEILVLDAMPSNPVGKVDRSHDPEADMAEAALVRHRKRRPSARCRASAMCYFLIFDAGGDARGAASAGDLLRYLASGMS